MAVAAFALAVPIAITTAATMTTAMPRNIRRILHLHWIVDAAR